GSWSAFRPSAGAGACARTTISSGRTKGVTPYVRIHWQARAHARAHGGRDGRGRVTGAGPAPERTGATPAAGGADPDLRPATGHDFGDRTRGRRALVDRPAAAGAVAADQGVRQQVALLHPGRPWRRPGRGHA